MGQVGEDAGLDVESIKAQWEALTDLPSRLNAIASTLRKQMKCRSLQETALNTATDIFAKAGLSELKKIEASKACTLLHAAILKSMKAYALAQNIQIAALRTLISMVELQYTPLIQIDAESALVAFSALTLHPSSLELPELAITVMAMATEADEALWDAGALLPVLSALRGKEATQTLQHKAFEVLAGFTDNFGEELVRANAAEAIMACMEANPDHYYIMMEGVSVLTYLAKNEHQGLRQMLLDKGCFKVIFAYIATRTSENDWNFIVDTPLPMLKELVRRGHQEQVLQMMGDGALDVLLACLERDPYTPMLEVLRAAAEASSRNSQLRALLQGAGVVEKLVRSLKAGEDDPDDDTCFALSELAESWEDLLGDIELAEKLAAYFFFFRVSVVSGRSCPVILDSHHTGGNVIATAVRKLQLSNVQDAGATLLLGNEPLPAGRARDWGLVHGKIYDCQLVFSKRRRLTDTE